MRAAGRTSLLAATAGTLAAALAACTGPGPGEKDTEYASVDDLHASATTAGLTCFDYVPVDSAGEPVELAECDGDTLLAVFDETVDEEEFVALLPRTPESEEEAALVGPNWVVVGGVGDLMETQAGIGGEMDSDR
ncbi:hypothetical protein [Cellulosimicrobium sp. CUA-896]|uniref:hypothetical protein n=1 Tax=Cellulosimicrobium sp. CUA-896 TaxID=1517881 RepID=UPI000961AB51|nr:hypothetical protein [Cellulosimicrobium sp. CUA-896]OLT51721.1 hypothetical protein BJF88_14530 [Cellulosimicrobium sp. CUA-896]